MGNQPKPRRYDHVGAWFMTPQASRCGLVFAVAQAATPFVTEHLADAARSNRISQAVADGKCRKCGIRPIVRLGKCSERREVIRIMNRTLSCT